MQKLRVCDASTASSLWGSRLRLLGSSEKAVFPVGEKVKCTS